jgi:predicted transcriptional regulator
MVSSVGRKKKDADRVNYNISRSIRAAVFIEADKLGWNEIDTIEDLLKHGLAAKAMLKSGDINYADFVSRMDEIMKEAQKAAAMKDDLASEGEG